MKYKICMTRTQYVEAIVDTGEGDSDKDYAAELFWDLEWDAYTGEIENDMTIEEIQPTETTNAADQ